MSRRNLSILLVLAAIGGAFGGGWYGGNRLGYRGGFADGKRYGEIEAAKKGSVPIRDKKHARADLLGALDLPVEDAEAEAFVSLLNRAPSPCSRAARRGVSLATSLLEDDTACATSPEQARLALAALRSFPEDPDEVLAVLRVEKRAQPKLGGRPRRGAENPSVVVVEYGDFQCPYCVRAQSLIDDLLEAREDVAVTFRHMPLSFHKAALPAALAVEAAGEQDAFWAMHDALFELGKGVKEGAEEGSVEGEGVAPFESLARGLELDIDRYRRDLRSPELRARVQADLKEARAVGVTGTPSFFIGNRKVTERPSVATFSQLVDKAIAEADWKFSWDLEPPAKR